MHHQSLAPLKHFSDHDNIQKNVEYFMSMTFYGSPDIKLMHVHAFMSFHFHDYNVLDDLSLRNMASTSYLMVQNTVAPPVVSRTESIMATILSL